MLRRPPGIRRADFGEIPAREAESDIALRKIGTTFAGGNRQMAIHFRQKSTNERTQPFGRRGWRRGEAALA